MNESLDLTPSPRVLRMLGQIDFKPWQCIAELVDNSVDAFLGARDDGNLGVMFPQVNVEVSSQADIRSGAGMIELSDNGPGMTKSHLENAVRAGFSGNNSIDKLGLFGMGFNVATARLGNRTEVWTTRLEDDAWSGVRIDFDEMERSGSFHVPPLRRPKSASETSVHGTRIVISKVDRERALYLRSGAGLRATREKLSRVYNKIMREIALKVVIAGTVLESREFCTWDQSRAVETKGDAAFGRVPAYLPIDEDLGPREYCDDCWIWLLEAEQRCPVCGSTERLRLRERRVHGWLGVQRYFDQNDYGIDLVRNGRVIEERSKGFFSWTHPDTGEVVPEYPLEQTHWGGRIVGELAVDFVPLASHQKDAFDKRSPEWGLVEKVVRGEGPLLVQLRKQLGLPERNTSPLARLHVAYRRGHPPGLRTLVPGDASGKGMNEEPKRWAAEFWAGNPEYLSDERWWSAVLQAEQARTKKGADTSDIEGPLDLGRFAAEPADSLLESTSGEQEPDEPAREPRPAPSREEDPTLSGVFELPEIPGSPRLDVAAEKLTSGSIPAGRHVDFAVTGSRIAFTFDPRHPLFTRSLVEPVDCLVEELAYQMLQRSLATQHDWPLSRVVQMLREKYFRWTLVTFEYIREEAEALLKELIDHYQEELPAIAPISLDLVGARERAQIATAVARVERAGEERVQEVIQSGAFPRFLGHAGLPGLLHQWPNLALDSKFFAVGYSDVAPELRTELAQQVATSIQDLLWVLDPGGSYQSGEEWRSRLARAASSLRLLDAWRV